MDLSPETRELLERAQDGERMPAGRCAATKRRLAGALGVAGATAAMGASATASGATALWVVVTRAVSALAIVSAAGAGTIAAMHAVETSGSRVASSAPPAVSTARAARRDPPASVAPPTIASHAPPPDPPTADPLPPTPPAAPILAPRAPRAAVASGTVAPHSASASPTAASRLPPSGPAQAPAIVTTRPALVGAGALPAQPIDDPLAAEASLIRSAQSALATGEPTRALTLLDEHQRRFPGGALEPERASLRVDALCAAGRAADATIAARRFRTAHPGSPLDRRWKRSCVDPETP